MRRTPLLIIPIVTFVGLVVLLTAGPADAQTQPAPVETGTYVVVPDDNLWDVSQGCPSAPDPGGAYNAVLQLQNDEIKANPRLIEPEQRLPLPLPTALDLGEPTSLGEAARRCGVPWEGVALANDLPADPNFIVPAGRVLNMVPPPPPEEEGARGQEGEQEEGEQEEEEQEEGEQDGASTTGEPKLPTGSSWFPLAVAGFAAILVLLFWRGRRARRRIDDHPRRYERVRLLPLVAACFATGVVLIGLLLSLPAVAEEFGGATQKDLLEIPNGYTLLQGSLLLLAAAVAKCVLGKRLVLCVGAVHFVAGAGVGIGAGSLADVLPVRGVDLLTGASWLLGAGAAAMVFSAFSYLGEFDAEKRAGVVSLLMGATLLGVVIGPLTSAYLIRHWGRASIYLALVAAGLVIAAAAAPLRPDRPSKPKWFDVRGGVEVVSALGLISYGSIIVDQPGQARTGSLALLVGAALLADFVWKQRKVRRLGRDPVLPLELFRVPRFAAACALAALVWHLLLGHTSVIGVFLQVALQLDPVAIGGLVLFFGAAIVGVIADQRIKMPDWTAVVLGFVLFGAGLGIGSLVELGPGTEEDRFAALLDVAARHGGDLEGHLHVDWWPIVAAFVVAGIGVGLLLTRLTSIALTPLPDALRDAGTAFFRAVGFVVGGLPLPNLLVNMRYRGGIGAASLEGRTASERELAQTGLVDAGVLARSLEPEDPLGALRLFHGARESAWAAITYELRLSAAVAAVGGAVLSLVLLHPLSARWRLVLASGLAFATAGVAIELGGEVNAVVVLAVLWLVVVGLTVAIVGRRRDGSGEPGHTTASQFPSEHDPEHYLLLHRVQEEQV